MLSPSVLLFVIFLYFGLLMLVSWLTSKNSNNDSFFIGNRAGNWKLVAFGMIGSTLSGATFVSVPGMVSSSGFSYLQVTFGYIIGYIVVAFILLPIYYRMKLTSIYTYLQERMGTKAYQSGSLIFIISKLVGATGRVYLAVNVLQIMILDSFGIPFWLTTLVTLIMIILYTYNGGVKTIIYTDTLQTTAMLLGLVISVGYLLYVMDISVLESFRLMSKEGYAKIFNTDVMSEQFFVKQIIAGAFITIAMTGIDQDMMQKNIAVSTLKDSQKNMVVLGFILLGMIGLFLYLGGVLSLFAQKENIQVMNDKLFPVIAIEYMPSFFGIVFVIGLISALFSSADGAMTALTSSLCIDIFGIEKKNISSSQKEKFRKKVHIAVVISFLLMTLIFKWIDDDSMINLILKLAGFTYGPLLGLFAFGIFTKYKVRDSWVPLICILSPLLSFLLDKYQGKILGDFKIGIELLIINGFLTFLGLWFIAYKKK